MTYLGAHPVFIDSEPDTWNMDPAALEKAFALYGTPRAVVVVHLYGNPAKADVIRAICDRYGVPLIEDAAEALGSEYKGKKCGRFGSYGVLSFNGNKIITTSGGGMLLTSSKEDADHALKLATQAREPVPWYEHTEIGYNYRLSNISAGIGRGQMHILRDRIAQKRAIFARYAQNLAGLPIELQTEDENAYSNRWLSVFLLRRGCGITPADVIRALSEENIESRHVWKPMHMQPVFADAGYVQVAETSVSEDLFTRGVCLPSDTKMSMEDVDRVCEVLRKLF